MESKLPEEALQFFREKGKKGGTETFKRHGLAHMNRMADLAKIARKKKKV